MAIDQLQIDRVTRAAEVLLRQYLLDAPRVCRKVHCDRCDYQVLASSWVFPPMLPSTIRGLDRQRKDCRCHSVSASKKYS